MYTIGKGSRSTFGDNYDDDFDKELFFEEEEIKEDNIREEIEQEISKIDDTTQYGNYTWNDFYSAFDEAKNNTVDYSNAIYIGWTLIAPTIKSRKLNSVRGDRYNHVQDLMQEAYLIIAKNIDNYDPTKAQFSTYIDKFLVGASREIENPDVSDYQFRKKNIRFFSFDDLSDPNQENSNKKTYTFSDEHASVEDIIDQIDRERSSQLFEQMMEQTQAEGEVTKDDMYTNVVFLHKFLGGVNNLPHYVREEIEESLGM